MTTQTILEACESADISDDEAATLVDCGLIYRCDDGHCGDFFHIHPEAPGFEKDSGWAAIGGALTALRSQDR